MVLYCNNTCVNEFYNIDFAKNKIEMCIPWYLPIMFS